MQLYALECFISRLALSDHRHRLVLKGGVLMAAFDHRRPTRDVDLLAIGIANDEPSIAQVVRSVACVALEDGLMIEDQPTRIQSIRDGGPYSGVRVSVDARLATARLPFHVDVNVGDPVTPAPLTTSIPRLLGGAPVEVMAYPRSMVIAEKLVTALERGGANTRWRDFADLYLLLAGGGGGGGNAGAAESLLRVAEHRGVALVPFAKVRTALAGHASANWRAWRRKQRLDAEVPEDLDETLAAIERATEHLLRSVRSGR